MIEFAVIVFLVSLLVKFLRTLAEKWGILEWAQINSPNEFFDKLTHCPFCQSFWLGLAISIVFAISMGEWWIIFVPIFSCNIQW